MLKFLLMQNNIFLKIPLPSIDLSHVYSTISQKIFWILIGSIHAHFVYSVSYSMVADHFNMDYLFFVPVVWRWNCSLFDITYHMMLNTSHFSSVILCSVTNKSESIETISTWSTIEFEIKWIKGVWMHPYSGFYGGGSHIHYR